MSGFLQRIAASALGASPTVHPVVKPRFAAAREEGTPSPVEFGEEGKTSSVQREPAVTTFSLDDVMARLTDARERSAEPDAQNTTAHRARYQPLLPERVQDPRPDGRSRQASEALITTPRKLTDSDTSAAHTPFEQSRRSVSDAESRIVRDQDREQRPRGGEDYTPLVQNGHRTEANRASDSPGRLMPLAAPATPMFTPPWRREGPSAGRDATARVQGEREVEREDIQIHIGRIEVTAVLPAPAPGRPAASARKTQSLDDYLRGSGERRWG